MRISDWSSDVCSSDLFERLHGTQFRVTVDPPLQITVTGDRATDVATLVQAVNDHIEAWVRERPEQWFWVRSEEHTSELQSLMRISYAVFCLKKKKYAIPQQ